MLSIVIWTGYEKIHLPHTQHQDTLFTITQFQQVLVLEVAHAAFAVVYFRGFSDVHEWSGGL